MRESWDIGLLEFSCYNKFQLRIGRRNMNRFSKILFLILSFPHAIIPVVK